MRLVERWAVACRPRRRSVGEKVPHLENGLEPSANRALPGRQARQPLPPHPRCPLRSAESLPGSTAIPAPEPGDRSHGGDPAGTRFPVRFMVDWVESTSAADLRHRRLVVPRTTPGRCRNGRSRRVPADRRAPPPPSSVVAVHGIVVEAVAGWQASSVIPGGRASIAATSASTVIASGTGLPLAVLAEEDAAVRDGRTGLAHRHPEPLRRAPAPRHATARRDARAGGSRGGRGRGRPCARSPRAGGSSSGCHGFGVSLREHLIAGLQAPSRYSHSPRSRCSPTPSEPAARRRPPPPPRAGHRTISVALVTMPSSWQRDHAVD